MTNNDKWYMAGTEGTGEYLVIRRTDLGAVGIRLRPGFVRIRVEATDPATRTTLAETLQPELWKQPGGSPNCNLRFSHVTNDAAAAITAVETAIQALGRKGVKRNLSLHLWRGKIRKHFAALAASSGSEVAASQ